MRTNPVLYEINTWPWLERLSRRAGRRLTLGSVPDAEWDRLGAIGVDCVYLMGIWRRSAISRRIARSDAQLFARFDRALPDWRAADVVGSAYSVAGYDVDPILGTNEDLAQVRGRLHARGMRLIVDFVCNHTAFDHPWVVAHPERYVCAPEALFRGNPRAFQPIEVAGGDVRFVACGRDPFFPPWTDVAQLNYFRPETRHAMIDELRRLAARADGARCDMAMLVLSDVFARTWGHIVGAAPDVLDFWADAAAAVPDFYLIAEVYWDLERRLQQLGFGFTYDKSLYDRLLHGTGASVRDHLRADVEYQRKSARFVENHDEPRSAAVFGDRVRAAAVAALTVPGMRFLHDGQIEGRRLQTPVQLSRFADEPVDEPLRTFYERLLAAIASPAFHEGDWRLLDVGPGGGESYRDLAAWRWQHRDRSWLVVVNLGHAVAQGYVRVNADLPSRDRYVFEDALDGRRYPWERGALEAGGGLYVRLDVGGAHVFRIL